MSRILAIDTAAPRLQLALRRGDGSSDALVEDMPQGQAERIFLAIDELLRRNRVTYADLDRIAVTTGPGSFTGLRIGLSAARGLGLALDIPVIGVPSLLAISLAAPTGAPVAVLLDARRDEAYFQSFAAPGVPLGDPVLTPMAMGRSSVDPRATLLESPFVDPALLASFAVDADPAAFRPEASYVRSADAKPQDRARLARTGSA